MTDYSREQQGRDCPPHKDPAPQPHPPGSDCPELPKCPPPELKPPEPCPTDPCCNCPPPPDTSPDCLEVLVAARTAKAAADAKANEFNKELDTLKTAAKQASADYTRDKYEGYVRSWVQNDQAIADLIRRLVCVVPCWRCIIECYVCPLLNNLHDAEKWLYDDGTLYSEVHDLLDLRYWHDRDRDAKKRRLARIKGALTVWTDKTALEKAFKEVGTLYADADKSLAPKTVYDVFLRLVPLHLAIAPPDGSKWVTLIAKEYTVFCPCDEGIPDDCCGPDVGIPSLRQRLVKPQRYLIDPNEYYKVICCLVEKRLIPAWEAWAAAEADFQRVDERIKTYTSQVSQIEDGPDTFHKAAKDAIPTTVDCCKIEKASEAQSLRAR